MTDQELMKVRLLMAEARAAGASRHADWMSEYVSIVSDIAEAYREFVPEGYTLPEAIRDRISVLQDAMDRR